MVKRLKSKTRLIYLAIAVIVILMLIFGKSGREDIETLENGLGLEEDAGSGFLEVETFPSDADIYVDGILKGKRATCYVGIIDDLRNAGAKYVDRTVVIDGNIITASHPRDVGDLMKAILSKFKLLI